MASLPWNSRFELLGMGYAKIFVLLSDLAILEGLRRT